MSEEGAGGAHAEKPKRGTPGGYYRPTRSSARACCCALLLILLALGIIALVLYLVYRPNEPRFAVVGAAVYELNATSPNATAISTTMQFTLAIRNPSGRSSIYYDRLAASLVYRSEAITPTAPLPPLFQDKDSTVMVSPVLAGEEVPVSAETLAGLMADQTYGLVAVRLVVRGRLKYRAGPFKSPWYRLYVRCNVLLGLKKGKYGQVPLLGTADCSVDT